MITQLDGNHPYLTMKGLNADRLAILPQYLVVGSTFYETDTGNTYTWNYSTGTWSLGAGSTGGMTLAQFTALLAQLPVNTLPSVAGAPYLDGKVLAVS